MNKLLTILFLVVAVSLSAQYTVKHQGKIVKYNGQVVKAQTDNIPTSPDDIPVNPDSITVYRSLDFDIFSVEDSVSEATVVSHIPDMYDPFTQNGQFPYWNIVTNATDDRVSEMIYPEVQCCFPYNDDNFDASPHLGTAGGGRYYIDGTTTYQVSALSWNIYLGPDFGANLPSTGGIKFMGLYNPSSGSRDSRIGFLELERVGGDSVTIKFYFFGYASDAATEISGPSTDWGNVVSMRQDTIPMETWVHYDYVINTGNVGSADGWGALFKNRVLVGYKTGNRFHSNADGGQVDFRVTSIELDAGGNQSVNYNFLGDSKIAIDNIVNWGWDNLGSYTPSADDVLLTVPIECDYPKTGTPF